MTTANRQTQSLSRTRKLIFSSIVAMLVAPPLFLAGEVFYRVRNGIPLTGGKLYEGTLRMSDDEMEKPWNQAFLARFRKSDNPILFYEPRPSHDDTAYIINSAGFRDREFPEAKPPNTFRIVVLGDSIIWGHGLLIEDSFAKQLETLLNQNSDRTFEVLNFGVSGYSTQQEVELYRVRAKRYDPDLVIVGYCLNDYLESSSEKQAFRQLYYNLFSKSYLFDAIKSVITGIAYDNFGYATADADVQADLETQFRLLQVYSSSIPRALVVFPTLMDFDNYPANVEHHRVKTAVAKLDYATLDLLDVYRHFDADELIQTPRDRTHPNAWGTGIAAEATMEFLQMQGLIPR